MRFTILCVGKLKERYYREAVTEFVKRLSRYGKLEIVEVADEKTPDRASAAVEDDIRAREGERLLKAWREDAHVIALDIAGGKKSSEQFADRLEKLGVMGKSHIVFVIGGSLGLAPAVLEKADERLSFSDMTFPHQLMRVILLEQIYRAFRIIHHEPYHK